MKANTNNDHQLTFKVEKFEGPVGFVIALDPAEQNGYQ